MLILHCILGIVEWNPSWDSLTERFTVYVPSHPWYGRSGEPSYTRSVEDLVYFYLDLFDAMRWDRIPLVGVSLGGWIALEMASRNPERIDRIVVAASLGLRDPDVASGELFGLSQPELLSALSTRPECAILNRCIGASSGLQMLNYNSFPFYKNMAAAARYGWNPYLHNPRLPERLHRLRCPVLILWGQQDCIAPPSSAFILKRLLPQARLETIAGAGHMLHFDAPEIFAEHVCNFLEPNCST